MSPMHRAPVALVCVIGVVVAVTMLGAATPSRGVAEVSPTLPAATAEVSPVPQEPSPVATTDPHADPTDSDPGSS